jgi:FeS assembly SUF system protein
MMEKEMQSAAEKLEPNEPNEPSEPMATDVEALKENTIAAIRKVYDPEIPVNVYDLGLIYGVKVADDNSVVVSMTLTSPNCPVAESLPSEVEGVVKKVDGVSDCEVEIVWEPPWSMDMMSEAARLELDMF